MSADPDRNLLLGILALQMDFVSRDGLVAAMNAWVLDKGVSLGQVLLNQRALDRATLDLLEALVNKHLQMHSDDPVRSLAAVSSIDSVRSALQSIADTQLHASLDHLVADHGSGEPRSTQLLGAATSEGGRFRILRPHARGGLGEVFVARDEELGRDVALKQIQSRYADRTESRSRFLLEAEITGGLEHPGIVPVYGLGSYADGRPYYAMRFVRGDSLSDAIRRFHGDQATKLDSGERMVQFRKLLGRFIDVCNAIEYAHSRGVLHRDLKPGNIMLGKYGETLVVDWGLAKALGKPATHDDGVDSERPMEPASGSGSAPTQMGAAIGTPQYMSPEQAAGRIDLLGPQSDVYSLGATLYCLLTGQPPLADARDVGEVLRRVQSGEIPAPRTVQHPQFAIPRPLEAICLKAMAVKPSDRFASPRELADDLERWLADETVTAYRESQAERLARWLRKHRTGAQAAVAALVATAVAAIVAAVLIGQAERREAVATIEKSRIQSADAIAQSFQSGLDATDWTPAELGSLESLLEQWRRLDSSAAEAAGPRLYRSFAQHLLTSLQRPKLEPEDIARIEAGLNALGQRAPAEAQPLREMLARRKDIWKSLVDLTTPYANASDIFDPSAIQSQPNGLKRSAASNVAAATPFVGTRLLSEAGSQLEVIFAPDWEKASEIGVRLNCQDTRGYAFVLIARPLDVNPDSSPASARLDSFQALRLRGANFIAEIRRNGKALHRESILAAEIPPGPLRLWAKRERDRLSFQISGRKPIEFLDASPLPSQAAYFALDWPGEATLRELHAQVLQGAVEASILEEADKNFDEGQIAKALPLYQNQAAILREPLLRQEARYKAALCLLELKRLDEAAALLEPLMAETGDRWPLLAGCQLWLCRLRQNRPDDADRIFDSLFSKYPIEQVAPLIPDEMRQQILDFHLGVFDTAHKFSRAKLPGPGVIERTAAIDRFLSPDGRGSEPVKYVLTISYLMNNDIQHALSIAKDAAETSPTARSIRIYSHVLRLAGKPREALTLIDKHLPAAIAGADTYIDLALELLIERSRVNVALEDWDAAEADLDQFASIVRKADERNSYVNHYHISREALLHGFLRQRHGDLHGATMIWREGLARIRPQIKEIDLLNSTNLNALLCGSLSDSLSDEDIGSLVEKLKRFLANYPGSVLLTSQLGLEKVAPLLRSAGKTRRGQVFAKAVAFDTPVDEMQRADWGTFVCVLGAEYMRAHGFSGELTVPQEDVTWTASKEIFTGLTTGSWGAAQLGQLALSWEGTVSFLGWGGLAPNLDPALRARLGYVFAHRLSALGQQADSETLLRATIQDAGADSALGKLAQADLDLATQRKGRLIVESEYPATVSIQLARADAAAITIDVAGRQECTVEPGDYDVRFIAPPANCTLSTGKVHVDSGEQRIVRITWLWQPGAMDTALPGLIPRPAQFPEIARWQMETRLSRGGSNLVVCNPVGGVVALGGNDGRIRLFDAKDRQLIGILPGHSHGIAALAFSPDGRWLASAGRDTLVRLWNMPTGQPGPVLRGHTAGVISLAWSPDSQQLVSGGDWGDEKIRIWDIHGGSAHVIDVHALVNSIAWSPDGKWIASVGGSNLVALCHADGTVGRTLEGHTDEVFSVSWSPKGEWLASGGKDKTVRLWNATTWARGPVLGPHDYFVSSLAWSHDGQVLAVGRQDGFVTAYHPPEPAALWSTPQRSPISSLVWKPDDSELITTEWDDCIERHWKRDGTAGPEYATKLGGINTIAVSADGKQLAMDSGDRSLRLWDFGEKLAPAIAGTSSDVHKIVWNHDGTRFATLNNDGMVQVWNSAGELTAKWQTPNGSTIALAWSHDGKWLATGGAGQPLRLWSVDGVAGSVFDHQPDSVLSLDWSHDDKWLAVGYGGADNAVRLVDAVTGKIGPVCSGHHNAVSDVQWSPNGKQLASASADGTVRIWKLTGEAVGVLQGAGEIRSVAWSPDNKLVLAGGNDGTCRLWKTDGALVRAWHAHEGEITAVAFRSDEQLITAGHDSVLRCWSVANGDCLRVLVRLPDQRTALFSDAGQPLDVSIQAANDFVYLVEKPDRGLELIAPIEFENRRKPAATK